MAFEISLHGRSKYLTKIEGFKLNACQIVPMKNKFYLTLLTLITSTLVCQIDVHAQLLIFGVKVQPT